VQVFLSYRRSDAGGDAGRLAETLASRIGHHRVVLDVTAPGGQSLGAAVDRVLERCDAVLAVIGPGWVRAAGPAGLRRLFQPDDYVHVELSRALRRGIPVVAVLVSGIPLPAPADLPADLRGIVRRPPVTVRDESWHEDVATLLRRIGDIRAETADTRPVRRSGASRRPVVVGAALVAVVALVAGAAWAWRSRADDGSAASPTGITACPVATDATWHDLRPVATKAEIAVGEGSLFVRVATARWRSVVAGTFQVVLGIELENLSPDSHDDDPGIYRALVVAGQDVPVTCFTADPPVVAANQKGRATVGFEVDCEPTGAVALAVRGGDTAPVIEGAASPTCGRA
jgi:TIR domain